MTVGTKSLIFGIHQIIIHPVVVYFSWKHLYGAPTLKEMLCIIVHDWGYYKKPNLDGVEGTTHPKLGADLMGKLFGSDYYDLCILHSRHYARGLGKPPSRLCWADKLSFVYENKSFYLFRARLSGELLELRELSDKEGFVSRDKSDSDWYDVVASFVREMVSTQTNGDFMHPE